ncbi:MAG: tRNA (N(6)-L-threonylcarbamoyladenosine(37)-C(2))-methylthiotransferase MtaB [Bacteroidia bacterium]
MNQARSIAFHTLGCKLNYSETSTVSRLMEENGYHKVDFSRPADIYVINTCSVTANADKECRMIVRQALKLAPEAFIVIMGCYAQLKPQEISRIEGVDLVLGASEKFKLLHYLETITKRPEASVFSCEIESVNQFVDAWSFGDRTRAFLKVQDGCDYTCTFCTIPLARGKSRSNTIPNVLKNIREIVSRNVKEIVLTGVNLGDFGKGLQGGKKKEVGFIDLIKELDTVEGIERYRISSIEPNLLSNEVIEFVSSSKRFAPHFHIPLQSGSDFILKKMKRRYLSDLYTDRVTHIRTRIPDACIGVDVITGFPGETDTHFLETYDYLNKLDISYLHVFTYSERDNTEAVTMENPVPVAVRRKRNKMLRILSVKKLRSFYEQHLDTKQKVLFEIEPTNGLLYGYTGNYIKVRTAYKPELCNEVIDVTLKKIGEDGCMDIEPVPLPAKQETRLNVVSI